MFKAILALSLVFLLFSVALGQQTDGKVVFKANSEFPIQLETAFSTDKIGVGDEVDFTLAEDVTGENGEKILKGATVFGRIVELEKISAKNETTKVTVLFDFIKSTDKFYSIVGMITTITPNADNIKMTPCKKFVGGTILSLKGKEIQFDKGKIFRIKLTEDVKAE